MRQLNRNKIDGAASTVQDPPGISAAPKICCPRNCAFTFCFRDIDTCAICGLGRTNRGGRAPEKQDYIQYEPTNRALKTVHLQHVFGKYLSRLHPGSLLDIGCSDGILMQIAAARRWKVTGIDSSPTSSPQIIHARFLDYEFSERFDFLTLIHSFEHMDDPRGTLIKCHSIMNATGRLLIVVPNFGGWWARIMGADWQWLNADDHRFHFTIPALKKLLEQSGFRIDSVATYSAFTPSLVEMFVSSRGIFDWPAFRWRPMRSLMYRVSRAAGLIANPLADLSRQGGEIYVMARPT